MKVAVVIPSNRELDDALIDKLHGADLIVVDGGGFRVGPGQEKRIHQLLTLEDQGTMGGDLDLIGQGSAALRNFGILTAYEQNYDVIVTLDDDCWPISDTFVRDYVDLLFAPHSMEVLDSDDGWVTTLQSQPLRFPRGYPYENRARHREHSLGVRPVLPVVQVGLWRGTQDLNALDKLTYLERVEIEDRRYATSRLISVCGMNFGCLREWAPFVYQVPWTSFAPTCGLERYDDIIGGLVTCTLAGAEGRRVGFGPPFVDHRKKDTDLLTHAWRENLGNVYIGRLGELFHGARGRALVAGDRNERAVALLEGVRNASEGTSSEDVVSYSVDMYLRWLEWFR